MKWASAASERSSLITAVEDCASKIAEGLAGETSDLVTVFVTPHYADQYDVLPEILRKHFPKAAIMGCSGAGVIGGAKEIEAGGGIAITAARLPEVSLKSLHFEAADLPSPDAPPSKWEQLMGVTPKDNPHFLILADPYTFSADAFIAGLDYAYPISSKVGGLASGAQPYSPHSIFHGEKCYRSGASVIAMCGDVTVDTVVAQGCYPFGPVMFITKAKGNIMLELDGKSPLKTVQELFMSLGEEERRRASRHLFIGIVMNPLKEEWGLGDFLIRNVVGADNVTGALAIGEHLREGQAIQFHIRDARTAADDLRVQLEHYLRQPGAASSTGALLFSCTGRGIGLYGVPDHDSAMFRSLLGPLPLGGFFCNGEIGPVAGTTYLHGYTSSFGLFRPLRRK
ncbi:MAG: hypothetical protein EXR59_04125 [Dehalococcoidia bacterium]|nr:hypothetical protein [Dehalococcoidia bacterium]